MMKLVQGRSYVAELSLGMVEKMASNEQVAAKFRAVGFTDVVVQGTGRQRHATGTWSHATRDVNLPSQVVSVHEQ